MRPEETPDALLCRTREAVMESIEFVGDARNSPIAKEYLIPFRVLDKENISAPNHMH
jgi:hypothetical protein